MRIIDMEQGSTDWLSWRKKFITGTDAPILLGVSPYATPYQGWQQKLSLVEEKKSNPAMELGRLHEPIARDWFNKEYGLHMEPCCIESDYFNFIGSSLDGLSKCQKYILEIKYNRKDIHEQIKKTKQLPDYHKAQVQHHLLNSDEEVEVEFYMSCNENDKICLEIEPDKEWLEDYIEQAKKYWKQIVYFEPPPLIQRDYVNKEDSEAWKNYAAHYILLHHQIKTLEIQKEEIKKLLIDLCQDQNSIGMGLKAFKKTSRGRIDYDSIPELAEVNLEKYRKPSFSSWTLLVDQR